MAKLKVFGGLMHGLGELQVRTVIAARSKKRAAELLGISIGEINSYWSETSNTVEVALALSHPETVYQSRNSVNGDFIQAENIPVA